MDFSDAEDIPVTQKLDVVESNDVVEYQLRYLSSLSHCLTVSR